MYEIDRIAAVVRPTKAFLDWVNKNCRSPGEENLVLEEVQSDCTVLLLPLFDDAVEAENYIESIYKEIFENEIEAWSLDPAAWPENRTYELFQQWFFVEFHSFVFDTNFQEPNETPTTIQ